MIEQIIYRIIKFFTNVANKLNLNRYIHDKIIYYIGLNQILENK